MSLSEAHWLEAASRTPALLLSGAAVAIALGQVVNHGAVVRLGPGVPGEGNVATSLDRDRGLAGSSFL
jgi:hypothetical protein